MNSRALVILGQFASNNDSFRISQDFWTAAGVMLEECDEVSCIISMVLMGYALADTETQEIIEIIGESNLEADGEAGFAEAD